MKSRVKQTRKIFDENPNLTVVCHSFGGILFNCALQKFKKAKIKKVVFINSPFNMNIFGMKYRKNILGYKKDFKYNFKVFSWGSFFDEIVPFFWTKYGNEKHYTLIADHHLVVLFVRRVIRKIMHFSDIN